MIPFMHSFLIPINTDGPNSISISSLQKNDQGTIYIKDFQIKVSNKNDDSPGFEYMVSAIAENKLDQPQLLGLEIETRSEGWLSGASGKAYTYVLPASSTKTVMSKIPIYPANTYKIYLKLSTLNESNTWKDEQVYQLPAKSSIFSSTTIHLKSGDLYGL